MDPVIVDTNVPLVANGAAEQASIECQLACIAELSVVQRTKVCLLDSDGAILGQYLKQKPHGYPQGPGDAFLVWVYDNQANPDRCRIVSVTPIDDPIRLYEEFPDDVELIGFDRDEHKFVAVAIAHGDSPPILNASDTDWKIFEVPLRKHGIGVKFLCPDLMG